MLRLKIFFYVLFHPSEWSWLNKIKYTLFKIRDYDRMEYDYGCVLDHATYGRMSKTNYLRSEIYTQIEQAQSDLHWGIIKSDLQELIDQGGTMEDIQKYINDLN